MNANEIQVGGAHYKSTYQPWDFTMDMFGGCFFLGNANKYITRWRNKNGVEDLRKAKHYLDKFLDLCDEGRITLPTVRSTEAIDGLLKVYSEANDLGLTEREILFHMAKGDYERASHELSVMIATNESPH